MSPRNYTFMFIFFQASKKKGKYVNDHTSISKLLLKKETKILCAPNQFKP